MSAEESIDTRGLPPGEVITFYSYKGGTGRSMLLANVAWQLATVGCKVLVMDWDLEAPGLHRYFRPFLGGDVEMREQKGIMEWITDYWDAALDDPGASVETLVQDYADPRHYVRRLNTQGYLQGGIDLMCAGRQDRNYARLLTDFDFTKLFEKLRGEQFIDVSKRILVGQGGYDYVLVDSRTGVSDTSGLSTVALADTLVVCFTYNNQSLIGASQIARDIKQQIENKRLQPIQQGTGRRFRLFAVPCRLDDLDTDRLERRERHARNLFADLLTDVDQSRQAAYWGAVQIWNHGLFAYEETLAVCMNRPTDQRSMLFSITQLTRELTKFAFQNQPALTDDQRSELRERFSSLGDQAIESGPPRNAWTIFCSHVPETGSRISILETCFPLLVQLFTTAPGPGGSVPTLETTTLIRTALLEAEFTSEESRMAESLIAVGLCQPRITDDRQRALIVPDDSIQENWAELRARLLEQTALIALRERVRHVRRSWEVGGRSIDALRALQSQVEEADYTNERGAWLGRPNLQFLNAMREVRSQMRERATARKIGIGTVAVVLTLVFSGIWSLQTAENRADARVSRLQDQLEILRFQREADIRARVEAESNANTLQRRIDLDQAMVNMGYADQYFHNRDYAGALAHYSKVIEADPKFAEAYKGRALARGNMSKGDRDVPAEFNDWARFYDLRPSLDGRSKLILRALEENPVDKTFVSNQLKRLLADATTPGPNNHVPPVPIATRLDSAANRFPSDLHDEAKSIADQLRGLQKGWPSQSALESRAGPRDPLPGNRAEFGAPERPELRPAARYGDNRDESMAAIRPPVASSVENQSPQIPAPRDAGAATLRRTLPSTPALKSDQNAPPPR